MKQLKFPGFRPVFRGRKWWGESGRRFVCTLFVVLGRLNSSIQTYLVAALISSRFDIVSMTSCLFVSPLVRMIRGWITFHAGEISKPFTPLSANPDYELRPVNFIGKNVGFLLNEIWMETTVLLIFQLSSNVSAVKKKLFAIRTFPPCSQRSIDIAIIRISLTQDPLIMLRTFQITWYSLSICVVLAWSNCRNVAVACLGVYRLWDIRHSDVWLLLMVGMIALQLSMIIIWYLDFALLFTRLQWLEVGAAYEPPPPTISICSVVRRAILSRDREQGVHPLEDIVLPLWRHW